MKILIALIVLFPIYVIVGIYYGYKVLSKKEEGDFESIDLDSVSHSSSISFKIDQVQVLRNYNEISISILGLTPSSEIKIENTKGDLIYRKETDKSFDKIALKTSTWKRGTYVFSYVDAGNTERKYVTGVFEV